MHEKIRTANRPLVCDVCGGMIQVGEPFRASIQSPLPLHGITWKETQMSTINFNANEVEPSTGYDPIPAGKYQAVITESEMKPTRTGNGQYLQLEFEIIEGEYKNRKVWARLNLENANADAVRIARADLSAICRAVNVLQPRDSVELHNLPLTITVRCKKNQDDEIVNEIKGYGPRTSLSGVAAAKPATPPPQSGANSAPPWARK